MAFQKASFISSGIESDASKRKSVGVGEQLGLAARDVVGVVVDGEVARERAAVRDEDPLGVRADEVVHERAAARRVARHREQVAGPDERAMEARVHVGEGHEVVRAAGLRDGLVEERRHERPLVDEAGRSAGR